MASKTALPDAPATRPWLTRVWRVHRSWGTARPSARLVSNCLVPCFFDSTSASSSGESENTEDSPPITWAQVLSRSTSTPPIGVNSTCGFVPGVNHSDTTCLALS